MSLAYQNIVLSQSQTKGPPRLLLMILAHHANEDGVCWPGQPLLAQEMQISLPSLKRAMAQLKESGEILISEGRGRSKNCYYLITLGQSVSRLREIIRQYSLKGINIDTFLTETNIPPPNQKGIESAVKGIKSDTIKPEKKVSNLTQKGIESVVKGIRSDSKGIKSDTQNYHELTGTSPNREGAAGDSKITGPSDQDLKRLRDIFLERTGMVVPRRRNDQKVWAESLVEIHHICGGDLTIAERIIPAAIARMTGDDLSITSPRSIEGECRKLAGKRNLQANGRRPGSQTNGLYRRSDDMSAKLAAYKQMEAAEKNRSVLQ